MRGGRGVMIGIDDGRDEAQLGGGGDWERKWWEGQIGERPMLQRFRSKNVIKIGNGKCLEKASKIFNKSH